MARALLACRAMTSTTYTGCIAGIQAIPIQVEVNVKPSGYPGFRIVGLAQGAVKESKVRVLAALARCGYHFEDEKVTVNLAPADIRKSGSSYDLAIAVGLLMAKGIVPAQRAAAYLFLGELSFNACIRPVSGALPVALCARSEKRAGIILPENNAREACIVPEIEVNGAASLPHVVSFLKGTGSLTTYSGPGGEESSGSCVSEDRPAAGEADISDVKGQLAAKRALTVAAAGGHNVLMAGPPGAGKTMLARAFSSIQPALNFEESIETTAIYSVAGLLQSKGKLITARPFRSPHHSISYGGLIGGGCPPRPGEVSLAHNGVLFLDEFPEYSRYILDLMRQPLEDERITLSRSWGSVTYPARFMLIAAMNPCPCGNLGSTASACRCSPEAIRRYTGRISGPIMDRIDLRVSVPFQRYSVIAGRGDPEEGMKIRKAVRRAREIQRQRFSELSTAGLTNASLKGRLIEEVCRTTAKGRALLETAVDRFGLSARTLTRLLKVSRTIADIEDEEDISESHIREALQFRLDGSM